MGKRGMTPRQAAKLNGENMTKLKRVRVAKGYSQSELAALSGIPVKRIQHYEQRVRPIDSARLDTLCSLCVALGCKLEDVLERKAVIERLRLVK